MNAPAETAAIETRGLRRTFGDQVAVDGLDLDVPAGALYGLVGPDGAGKSTTIRLLCGILRPSGGTARVLGHDLLRQSGRVKAAIGYLSQDFTLYGDLTVDENIAFFARLHGVSDFARRRDELLDFTGMGEFRRRLADRLSGGMKKKLALACTLVHTPRLILLDEPSTGVDPVSRGEFWNILSGILEQGVTVLMTTPYLDEAERCSRIGLMHAGRLVRAGTPDEVRGALPGAVYEIGCADLDGAYHRLRERWPSAQLVLYGDRLHFRAPAGEEDRDAAASWLSEGGCDNVRFKPVEPSLEDVFIALLGQENSP